MSYTPSQVSEMLDIKPSTLRRYSVEFEHHLSELARSGGKKRKYTDDDVLKLKTIKQLVRERKSPDDIRQALEQTIIQPEQPEQAQPSSALALLPEVLEKFENLSATIRQLEHDRDDLRGELGDTRERLQRLEEWLKTPWYKRIGKRPPE